MDLISQAIAGSPNWPEPVATAVRAVAGASKGEAGMKSTGVEPAPAALPSAAALKDAVQAGTKALQQFNQSLEFQIDEKSKQSVVRVVDTQTKEVIRQIPTPEFLRIAENIDAFQAHLIHEKA
jgi:flagellar protein FlaG